MSPIDSIVEELKILPPQRLEQAAHGLREASRAERLEALRTTPGVLTRIAADDWAKAIE